MIIAVDFDGTIVEHAYPAIGNPVPLALETLKELTDNGHQLILYTIRSDSNLEDAVYFLNEKNIPLLGVNVNPKQHEWSSSPKCYAHVYIDDAALGCPLVTLKHKRPAVDWKKVRELLVNRGLLPINESIIASANQLNSISGTSYP